MGGWTRLCDDGRSLHYLLVDITFSTRPLGAQQPLADRVGHHFSATQEFQAAFVMLAAGSCCRITGGGFG